MEEIDHAVQKYAEVQRSLDVNKSLPWQLSIDTLRVAWLQLAAPQTEQFLDDYLFKVISLMTSQSPSKLGAFERNVMDESITITVNILLKILPNKMNQLHTLARIFDASVPYYTGGKVNYTFTPGHPAVRLHAIKFFAESGGFNILLDMFRQEQFVWPGGDTLLTILRCFSIPEVLSKTEDAVKGEFVTIAERLMLTLPDEQLKRESTEALNNLVGAVNWICKHLATMGHAEFLTAYWAFYFEFTLKLMNSGSLVLRLYAWDLLNELVAEARTSRPVASTYIVSGAGSDFVNGVYKIVAKPASHAAGADVVNSYTKAAAGPGVPLLTLFRCTMRTKAKWWFISHADLEKPGTDKDVDYYLHKSGPDDEHEPPARGWTRMNTNIPLLGTDPAPTVQRGSLLLGKDRTRESYFDHQLVELCKKNNVLDTIFGASIHREIVSRSGKLLVFLAEYDCLKMEDLQMIWKAAMQNTEVDIVDEVFAVLALVSQFLSEELFAVLMRQAAEALRQPEQFAKVAHFLEKFSVDHFRPVSNLYSEASAVELLSLAWEMYRSPQFESLKNATILQELLSHCLNQKEGPKIVVERIQECVGSLSKTATADPASVDETSVSRLVRCLFFLVAKHTHPGMGDQLNKEEFTDCLVAESKRYLMTHRSEFEDDTLDLITYTAQLSARLDILRKFYSIHPTLTLSMETFRTLSKLFSSNFVEVEVFFSFLRCCSKAVLSVQDALEVFLTFVCSPDVDWSKCGDEAFECFKTYFCELEGSFNSFPVGTELPPRLGLSTLWRIALSIGTVNATNHAINLLLQAYDTILFLDQDAYADMLKIVFSYLEDAINSAAIEEEGGTVELSQASVLRVSRCVSILSAALVKSKGVVDVPHAVRGTMHRMHITVHYRRVTSYYNATTQMDVVRAEKGSEGTVRLEVHPLHTVKDLKDRIIELGDLGSVTVSLDHANKDIITNSTRLVELGLVDGGDLFVTYQSAFAAKSYEDDVYSDSTVALGSSKVTHIGQVLAGNYSMFDCLLTLCELCKDPGLTRSIWQLIMLIPTQVDLMSQSVEQICYPDGTGDVSSDWNRILQNSSETRTAYLLQIIDNVLQPAAELMSPSVVARSLQFRDAFIQTNGFATVLRILITTPTDDSIVNSTTLSVALHIVHYLLFESELARQSMDTTIDMDPNASTDKSVGHVEWAAPAAALLEQVEACSAQVIEKLLHVARSAAAAQASQVVHNALMVITKLIKSPEAASQLTSNPQSEVLLTTVLRSDSKKVREMAAEFAVKVGRTQPVVFNWLLFQLKSMQPSDQNCAEIFGALSTLLTSLHYAAVAAGLDAADGCLDLALILSEKLSEYPRKKNPAQEERLVLLGYLETLNVLIGLDADAVQSAPLGENLVKSFLSEFLFAMPTEEHDATPICDTPLTRQAAFNVLASFLTVTVDGFETVLSEMGSLSKLAARHMHSSWGLQVSHDMKKADIQFSGLKNQGCTCYMNSLLQVLFMSKAFREAVLATPLKEIHRTTLWHKSDVELVGNRYMFEWANGSWRTGLVIGFDPITSRHRVQYTKSDGTSEDVAHFNLHEGRYQRETGRVRVIPGENEDPLAEREEAAYRVLDQLQRTFCFMKHSKKRFYDPMPFVEACKSLNLNFNVYHQNDAAEFCDQLLDRIETATKGKHTKKDIWSEVFLKSVFGGRWLYQKIPRDCEAYNTNKEGCGHWQSSRLESFLKVELMIRGKEKIEDSLAELMQGELMDGDNKIHCEVCTQKKATVRRTCFGDLPSTMILHLKRFDLDFQTFETVKLNNRLAFPQRINMLKFTKEGIEAEEKRRQAAQDAAAAETDGDSAPVGDLQYETDGASLDPSDYEYELQGVLVHAGVAQGGHYYSFIRDGETEDQWYKFDDDDVTPFSADQIPTQCFGGPPSANGSASMGNMMDEDRTSNALMLLYNKVKKPEEPAKSTVPSPEKPASMGSPSSAAKTATELATQVGETVLVDGNQAYLREVRESNLQHILTCYLLDPDLHSFVRGLLSSVTAAAKKDAPATDVDAVADSMAKLNVMKWVPSEAADDLPLRTVQFNITFLLDVVLHCRERAAMRSTVDALKVSFEAFPHTALWFVKQVVDTTVCSWFSEYLLHCSDALARGTFVQILVHAVTTIAPKGPDALAQYRGLKVPELRAQTATNEPGLFIALLVRMMIEHTFKAVNYVRTADELFVLMRDLAAIPSICTSLLSTGMVSFLSYFIMPELVPQIIRTMFEKNLVQSRQNARPEYTFLLQSVFEALAALLGVPQIRKVALLQDRTYWESDLVPEARDALTTMFQESAHGGGMDTNDVAKYFDRVTGGVGPRATTQQIRGMLDRFHTLSDGRLSLEGFLQYHTDLASYNPKTVWRDLHAFGYKNNLTRVSRFAPQAPTDGPEAPITDGSSDGTADELETLQVPENCRFCLSQLALYESGLAACEAAARAIAKRVCLADLDVSISLIHQALSKLLAVSTENSWSNHVGNVIVDFLRLLLGVQDGQQKERLQEILLEPKHGLAVVAYHEKLRPSNIRANDFDKFFLFNRYISLVQDLLQVDGVLDALTAIAETDAMVKAVFGCLRLSTTHKLTVHDVEVVTTTIVRVEHAGVHEVNGDYLFRDIRFDAGYYTRQGFYQGRDVTFTLYKCSLKGGGYQWFMSITPPGKEPGTTDDIDFYYATAKPQDKLPPLYWLRMNPDPQRHSRDPPPSVTCIHPDLDAAAPVHAEARLAADSSDSDPDSFMMVGDDGVDDSFATNGSDARDYYD